jgi:hypothetical protein
MRFPVRFYAALVLAAALAVSCGTRAQAQSAAAATAGSDSYTAINPLAGVRYDNRYDLSVGMAYDHMKAGPDLLQGANLGGLDLSASYWLSRHWGVEGSTRYYLGTSGAQPNIEHINGPFVSEYFFTAGPEWLGPHNEHGALIPHVLVGGVYGHFEQDLQQPDRPGHHRGRPHGPEPLGALGLPHYARCGDHPLQHQLRSQRLYARGQIHRRQLRDLGWSRVQIPKAALGLWPLRKSPGVRPQLNGNHF